MVHDFYNLRREACLAAEPHAGHLALALLQREWHGEFHLITQNVDDLHERAGSKGVLHMHGQLMRARCQDCGHLWTAPLRMDSKDECPKCFQMSTRPDVVWFGEEPYHMREIYALARAATVFVVIGSSGQVYPAADLADVARQFGAQTCEINLEPTDGPFQSGVYGKASEIVPEWVRKMLKIGDQT
jgi:NAD-dependent deacetylase